MGILGAAFGLRFVFGTAIGGFLARFGYVYPAYFAMAIALLTVNITLFTLSETVKTEDTQKSPKTKLTLTDFVSVVRSLPILDIGRFYFYF